jgi:hypothetical protein
MLKRRAWNEKASEMREHPRVEGKIQILFRVAEVVITRPEGTIREVLFPVVKEETFHQLAVESRNTGPQFRLFRQALMRRKFVRHYRRMLPLVLEILHFRSDNRFQPIVEALSAIQEALTTKRLEETVGSC